MVRMHFTIIMYCQYVVKKMAISNQAETQLRHLSSLEDPYIVSYKEAFYENNYVHLVMEYCEGGDLANVIKQRSSRTPPDKLPQQQILDWTLQICLGLKVCDVLWSGTGAVKFKTRYPRSCKPGKC